MKSGLIADKIWRREGDSNPRYGFWPYNGLANHRLQPLGHLSVFDSEAGLRRALKQFLSAARTIWSLRFVRQRKKLFFHMQAQDAATTYLFKTWAWMENNARGAMLAAGIIIVAIIGISFYSWRQGQKEIEAGNALSRVVLAGNGQTAEACLKVAADFPGTKAGQRAALQGAATLFAAGRYADAQAQFQKFLDNYPDNSLAPEAQLGVATSLDAQGKLDLAAGAYQNVINRSSDQNVTATARLGLAQIQEQQGKSADAQKNYEEVARLNPNSSLASEAAMNASQSKSQPPAEMQTNAAPVSFNLSH
jgi:TolA-binding protein